MARTSESPITFLLRDPKATKPTPIICIARFNNQRINIGTGSRVLPAHWSFEKERVKNVVAATDKDKVNGDLNQIEQIANALRDSGQLTKETLRDQVGALLRPKVEEPTTEPTEPALFRFIADFIEASPNRVNIETGKHVERRTIQKYQTVLKVLREFASIYPQPIDFDSVDLDFYEAFTAYLTTTKGFATNNVGKYIQTLKVFLNDAASKGIAVKQDYRNRKFKVVHENADSIYLSESELEQLRAFDLAGKERLERVRDLFLVGCYTGLRFSDLTNLRPQFIKNGFIRIEQQKTADKVVIPCHEVVTAMLKKYKGALPRAISNQKMNDYLKEVCRLAGITSVETKAQTKAGKRVTTSSEKWEMVSTHTARRSFATNMYLLGIPALTIMQITGHRTEKAFMKYIKLDREQHAQVMALHWQNATSTKK